LHAVLISTALSLNRLMGAEAELESWADDCVNLFLNGSRFWQPRAPR
jgi:hypothetical protein